MTLRGFAVPSVILFGAFAAVAFFGSLAGQKPTVIVTTLLEYTTSRVGFTEVVVHAIPLTLLGLGTTVALRGGLFNIGGDGQLILGALVAVALSPMLQGFGALTVVLFLFAGFLGGAMLGALVGWLRARFGASEIIVTIMFNYIMLQLASFAIRGPLQEPMHVFPRSFGISADSYLPIVVEGSRLHAGLVIALVATWLVHLLFARASLGFRISVVGAGRGAASYAGFKVRRLVVAAMLVSGGLSGLAGAVEIAGIHHRIEDNFADGFGLEGIAVALIARLQPLAVPLAAILFGVFYAGSGALQRELALPFPLVWIAEAVAIFAVVLLNQATSRRTVAV